MNDDVDCCVDDDSFSVASSSLSSFEVAYSASTLRCCIDLDCIGAKEAPSEGGLQ